MKNLLLWLFFVASITSPQAGCLAAKFEEGYSVKTVWDGKLLKTVPYDICPDSNGEFIFVLDRTHSNILKISLPLTQDSKMELIAGSSQGKTGYADGGFTKALFAHPRSLTVDSSGTLYVADRTNHAIRKIENSVVSTIAGGNTNKTGHVDGPGKDALFSGDFTVQYVSQTCSLLIVDTGNRMIRGIQLRAVDECVPRDKLSASSALKFENGYMVETLLDGNKLEISPYLVRAGLSGNFFYMLDTRHSNILKASLPLNPNSKLELELVAGSSKGYAGYVDAESREALFSHPKSLTVDSKNNIYVADRENHVIRKISSSDQSVTTIAGDMTNKTGHVDGLGKHARFSDDFSLEYIKSICSLLVVDKGNIVIRQIQLNPNDCTPRTPGASSGQGWPWIVLVVCLLIGILSIVFFGRNHITRFAHTTWQFEAINSELITLNQFLIQLKSYIRILSCVVRSAVVSFCTLDLVQNLLICLCDKAKAIKQVSSLVMLLLCPSWNCTKFFMMGKPASDLALMHANQTRVYDLVTLLDSDISAVSTDQELHEDIVGFAQINSGEDLIDLRDNETTRCQMYDCDIIGHRHDKKDLKEVKDSAAPFHNVEAKLEELIEENLRMFTLNKYEDCTNERV